MARIAIVGSGPAGFYAAGQLLASDSADLEVDMYDRLATPWGLVRAGVAPDHPKIKSVTRVYEKVARQPGFSFRGNVEVGSDIAHDELAAAYHGVLYAIGTAEGRGLGIPGEQLPGAHPATELVGWYNGHPDFAGSRFDFSAERAIVIGNGNVALDVARMLVLRPEELATTDTADHAIQGLSESAIREVVVIGRRGPAQASFTNPELRELGDLADAEVIVDPKDLELDQIGLELLEGADATRRRNMEILRDYTHRPPQDKPKRIVLRFLATPVEITGGDHVEGLRIVGNELDEDGNAIATGRSEVVPAGLIFTAIGYRGTPVPGLPFDPRRGTIDNDAGRVLDTARGEPMPGVYVAGWVKRGPSGVIGTNKKCAQETVGSLLEDLGAGRLRPPSEDPDALLSVLADRGASVVEYAGWEAIDAHEKGLGESQGRPRVKIVTRDEHLRLATGERIAG
jgi:ferredoxin--NADP+ reductase